MQFNDHLNINGVDTSPPASRENFDMYTYNTMLGGQLGGLFWGRDWERLHLQNDRQGGADGRLHPSAQVNLNSSGNLNGSPAGFFPFDVAQTAGGVAGVLDLSTMLSYQVRPNFQLRAGYELLYVPGVALSPDQLDGLVHQNGVFLHGPSAGLEFRW